MSILAVSARAALLSFFASLGLGIFLGILYDACVLLRILLGARAGEGSISRLASIRYPLLPPDFGRREQGRLGRGLSFSVTALFDFLFALLAGILILLFAYAQNDGILRLYYLVAAALGFYAYRITVGRLVFRFSSALVFLLRLLLSYFALFVRVPLIFLLRLSLRCGLALFLFLFSPIYGRTALVLEKRRAHRGFLPRGSLTS